MNGLALAQVILACATLVTAATGLVKVIVNGRKVATLPKDVQALVAPDTEATLTAIEDLYEEVRTSNGQSAQTMGVLASEAEERRLTGNGGQHLHSRSDDERPNHGK
jgi:hypothetical protein